ncbi:zinc ribbon domain-containing protein [Butyrivibrio sp. AE2032]|uniref:zinc ribbon domain-containing protein n=1 Tax=Butyrivibrio sp. AE2032 TaxID=1458463 RepID=UPI000557931A|nr:zinc ribbon domain-containing protein [Butyrivibrio sp. AE2032]
MARGGHHGGGFHGGGHHFSGGGFHGGGFGGGSFHSGGYHGGGYYGGGFDGDSEDTIVRIAVLVLVGLGYFGYSVAMGYVPGMNLINLGIFALSVFLYYFSLKEHDRITGIYNLNYRTMGFAKVQVWKADYKNYAPGGSVSDKVSWAAKSGNKYRIAFYDRDFGEENIRKVKELIKRTPKIIWMRSIVWLIIGIISGISTLFFYEVVIPYFEHMEMTDEAFAFIDELVFYFPAGVTLLCAISCYVLVLVRDNLLHKCALRIVEDNNAAFERMLTEGSIASMLSKKWYYNNCPNCGSDAKQDMRFCNHCGSSLEVNDISKEQVGAVHRISAEAENNGKKPEIIRHTD